MTAFSRRRVLGTLGTCAAGLVGGRYWLRRGDGPDGPNCPEYLEPTREYTRSRTDAWSRPVLDDDTVFVADGTGIIGGTFEPHTFRLLALDTEGEPKWAAGRELEGGIGVPRPTEEHVFAPTSENTLFALDRSTGRVQWEFGAENDRNGIIGWETAVHDGTVIAAVNNAIHDAFDPGYLVAGFAADDGSVQWTAELDSEVWRNLALIDETVVVATESGRVVGIDPGTGGQRWDATVDGDVEWVGKPVSFAEHALIPRADGTLVSFDLETGAITDRLSSDRLADEDDGSGFGETVLATDDLLIAGSLSGIVTAYDVDGSERWRYEGPARIAGLDLLDDRVAVLDRRGIYAELDRQTGDRRREFLLVDRGIDDRCGNRLSQLHFGGLVATQRSVFATGFRFGVSRYRLPAHE